MIFLKLWPNSSRDAVFETKNSDVPEFKEYNEVRSKCLMEYDINVWFNKDPRLSIPSVAIPYGGDSSF